MTRTSMIASFGAVLALSAFVSHEVRGQDKPLGLILNEAGAFEGYTLMAPFGAKTTFLLDLNGKIVHTWDSDCAPLASYLLENGNLLRSGQLEDEEKGDFRAGGSAGRVQKFSWDGELLWDFTYADENYLSHHDVASLPNGNVLMVAWEKKSAQEAVAAGADPEVQGDSDFWPDYVMEVKRTGKTTGEIVWEWHVWDHLIQDADASKPNYGVVGEHPERVNINPIGFAKALTAAERKRLESLGYLGRKPRGDRANRRGRRGRRAPRDGGNQANANQDDKDKKKDDPPKRPDRKADFCHTNGIAYNAELDQIALSIHAFSEIWIIDHSTTTEEAKGSTGGKSGKGGDLLYRWGNPRAYWQGSEDDRQLFSQHDVNWIPRGYPGAGHLTVFNNGRDRPDGENYSSIIEFIPPVDGSGQYVRAAGEAFGPSVAAWTYTAEKNTDFYSSFISGARRLPNGNTLICDGEHGTLFEVTPGGKTVWKYVNLVSMPERGGMRGPGGRSLRNAVFKVHRYGLDFAGLAGRDLTPGQTVAEWMEDNPDKLVKPDEDIRDGLLTILAALDTNNDHELSESEIDNASAALRALDRNGDRKVTIDDLRPEPDSPGDGQAGAGHN